VRAHRLHCGCAIVGVSLLRHDLLLRCRESPGHDGCTVMSLLSRCYRQKARARWCPTCAAIIRSASVECSAFWLQLLALSGVCRRVRRFSSDVVQSWQRGITGPISNLHTICARRLIGALGQEPGGTDSLGTCQPTRISTPTHHTSLAHFIAHDGSGWIVAAEPATRCHVQGGGGALF
jgi:hypothetical protein